MIGIFPNSASLVRMVATLLQEQDDEWQSLSAKDRTAIGKSVLWTPRRLAVPASPGEPWFEDTLRSRAH